MTVVARYPHSAGTRSREWASRHDGDQNARDWRRRGLSDKFDRTDTTKSMRFGVQRAADAMYGRRTGGAGWQEWHDRVRPLPHRIFALRLPPDHVARASAAGISVPDVSAKHDGQQSGALYRVLAVGDGVVSCAAGDLVVASSYVGYDLGDLLGDEIFELWCDVRYVDTREHVLEDARRPEDDSLYWYERRMSDVERRSGGDVLAVLTP